MVDTTTTNSKLSETLFVNDANSNSHEDDYGEQGTTDTTNITQMPETASSSSTESSSSADDDGDHDSAAEEEEKSEQSAVSSASSSAFSYGYNAADYNNHRFRALVSVVIINLRWAKEFKQDLEEFTIRFEEQGMLRQLTFNMGEFRARMKLVSGLTYEERDALSKHPYARSDEDLHLIKTVLGRYRCFNRFEAGTLDKICYWGRYSCFEHGRMLLRQGHPPFSMYFILGGVVVFKASEEDPRTGRITNYPMGTRTTGDHFGEVELLHDEVRKFTAETHGTVELLRIDGDPFNEFLQPIYLRDWTSHTNTIRNVKAFSDWTPEEIVRLYESASFLTFKPRQTVLSDVEGESRYVYFVIEGRCRVSKDMVFRRCITPTSAAASNEMLLYTLPTREEEQLVRQGKLRLRHENNALFVFERALVHLTQFDSGHYFGVGEDLMNIQIKAINSVMCVSVPRMAFEKMGKRTFLVSLQRDIESAIPDDKRILSDFVRSEKWERYRIKFAQNLQQTLRQEEEAQYKRRLPWNTTYPRE